MATEANTGHSVWMRRWESLDVTGIESYLTKMIMFPLSLVTMYTSEDNSEPRRKAWAETEDRIRHGHQVTSSEYWTDTGQPDKRAGTNKNTGWITQTYGHQTILLTRGHWDGVRCQDDFGKTLNIEYLVLSALSACLRRLPFAGAGLIYFISSQHWIISGHYFHEMYFAKITFRAFKSLSLRGFFCNWSKFKMMINGKKNAIQVSSLCGTQYALL